MLQPRADLNDLYTLNATPYVNLPHREIIECPSPEDSSSSALRGRGSV